jgi:hypothetical protein
MSTYNLTAEGKEKIEEVTLNESNQFVKDEKVIEGVLDENGKIYTTTDKETDENGNENEIKTVWTVEENQKPVEPEGETEGEPEGEPELSGGKKRRTYKKSKKSKRSSRKSKRSSKKSKKARKH